MREVTTSQNSPSTSSPNLQLDTRPFETHPRIELKMSNDQRKQETKEWHSGERTHLPPM